MPQYQPRSAREPEMIIGPVRTCVGCGLRGSRAELIRLVATTDGSARVDPHRDLPGRGAWIHPDPACLDRARRRRSLARALRLDHSVGEGMWADLEEVAQSAAQIAPDNE